MGPPRLAFLYGTREALDGGIARDLFAEKAGPIRDTFVRCEPLIRRHLGWSLAAECSAKQFSSYEVRQPVLTAVQLALTEAWRARGIEPDAVGARSGGEFAAEYARGTLTFENAVELACRVCALIRDRRGAGRTLWLRLGLSELERLRRAALPPFYVVWDVGEDSTLIACKTDAVQEISAFLAAHRIQYRMTESPIAPHCPIIDEWEEHLLRPLGDPVSNPLPIAFYSATAKGRDEGTSYPARLWRAVREPALTGRMLDSMIADGCTIFLEMRGQSFEATRIHRRAAAAGKQVITLPAPPTPFPAVDTADGKAAYRLPMPGARPFRVVMDEMQEILRRAGVFMRPSHVAKSIPV